MKDRVLRKRMEVEEDGGRRGTTGGRTDSDPLSTAKSSDRKGEL